MKKNWELAFDDYRNGLKYKEIANKYQVSLNTVRSWKVRKWNKKDVHTKKECAHLKGGAPFGNTNGTGPPKNKHAQKSGLFAKWLPEETKEIIGVMPDNPLDLLWANIQLQLAAIVRAQHIMHVQDKSDKTVERVEEKIGNVSGESWEVQQAWDKQANFMAAQSRAMKTLESMIKSYEDLLHKNWELATDEQKARIEVLKAKQRSLDTDNQEPDSQVVIINDLPK